MVLRADGGPTIGLGHVMRCVALAEAWRDRGGDATFVGAGIPGAVRRRLEAGRIGVVALAATASRDPERTAAVARRDRDGLVVLDGYHFDTAYQAAVRGAGCRTMVIDDTAHLPRYVADMLLNQNPGALEIRYDCPPGTRLLRGPRYALLRREFRRSRQRRDQRPTSCRILVTLGGSRTGRLLRRIMRGLDRLPVPMDVRVVAAPAAAPANARRPVRRGARLEVVRAPGDMAPLMRWADVVISGGGSTLLELACLGVPALAVVLAPNQAPTVRALAARDVVVDLGPSEAVSEDEIANRTGALLADGRRRARMGRRGRALVDGRGAQRVATVLEELRA
jgi:UDP-2,4-diacetamido-2,4,6-trideoxy-beta-L-altropyranose hydrolase